MVDVLKKWRESLPTPENLGRSVKGLNKTIRGDGDEKAEELAAQNIAAFEGIDLPEFQNVNFEGNNWLGDVGASTSADPDSVNFNPVTAAQANLSTMDAAQADLSQMDAVQMGDTAFDGVSVDPRLKDAQMAALSQLAGIAEGGGMNAADKANLASIQSQTGQADRGRREAILQNMQQRGFGGSGNELLAQLSSSQAATDRSSQEGLNIAGMAQQRALDAMLQGGNLAGGVRGQDFGEQSRVAQARDAVSQFNAGVQNNANQFNAGAANNMSQYNTGATNDARQFNAGAANQNSQFNTGQANNMGQFNASGQFDASKVNAGNKLQNNQFNAGAQNQVGMFNAGGRQDAANSAVTARNNTQAHNAQAGQQGFNNKMAKASGAAGVRDNLGKLYTGQSDGNQQLFGQIVSGGSQMGAAAATKSDERVKKNVKDVDSVDLKAFMSSINPKTFEYKDKGDGEGERAGVMAQDLQKSKLGNDTVVQSEDGTLGYDKDKLQGLTLAALKHLYDKVENKKG